MYCWVIKDAMGFYLGLKETWWSAQRYAVRFWSIEEARWMLDGIIGDVRIVRVKCAF